MMPSNVTFWNVRLEVGPLADLVHQVYVEADRLAALGELEGPVGDVRGDRYGLSAPAPPTAAAE